jgi:hypothetical protein
MKNYDGNNALDNKRNNKSKNGRIFFWTFLLELLLAGIVLAACYEFPYCFKNLSNNAIFFKHNFLDLSGSVDITPVDGLHIKAEKGSLHKKLSFRARKLDAGQTIKMNSYIGESQFAIACYQVDAGLPEDEIFFKPVQFSIDLDKLKIPANLYKYASVYRINEKGIAIRLETKINSNQLQFKSNKNSWLVLVLGFTICAAYYTDYSNKNISDYLSDKVTMDNGSCYRILWPKDLPSPAPEKVRQIREEFFSLLQKKGLPEEARKYKWVYKADAYTQDMVQRIDSLVRDSQFAAIRNLVSSEVWKRAFYWPASVAQTMDAIKNAHNFLINEKKFDPNCYTMDVVVRKSWPGGGNEIGLTSNRVFTLPFIEINSEAIKNDTDELNITVVHELFHAFQENFYVVRQFLDQKYSTFLEATAVMLENEAIQYYNLHNIIKINPSMAERDYDKYETMKNPIEDKDQDVLVRRHHGYVIASFLEYLRDHPKYYPGNRNSFLKNLMDSFKSVWEDDSSYKAYFYAMGKDEETLSKAFAEYCRLQSPILYAGIQKNMRELDRVKAYPQLFKDLEVNITPERPYARWDYSERPLACEFKFLNIQGIPQEALNNSLLIVHNGINEDLEKKDVVLRSSVNQGQDWKDVKNGVQLINNPGNNLIALQRISQMASASWFFSASGISGSLLMLPPEAPVVSRSANGMTVNLKKNKPAGIVNNYVIMVYPPSGGNPALYETNGITDDFPIKLDMTQGSGNNQNSSIEPYKVSYKEITIFKDGSSYISGPESKKAEFYPQAPQPVKGGIEGTWMGTGIAGTMHEPSLGEQTWDSQKTLNQKRIDAINAIPKTQYTIQIKQKSTAGEYEVIFSGGLNKTMTAKDLNKKRHYDDAPNVKGRVTKTEYSLTSGAWSGGINYLESKDKEWLEFHIDNVIAPPANEKRDMWEKRSYQLFEATGGSIMRKK